MPTVYTENISRYQFAVVTLFWAQKRKLDAKYSAKVVPIIKCTCTVFIDNLRNISTNSSISVCRGSYDRYVKHKRNDPMCDPWDTQGNEKMQFLFLLLYAWTFLSEMKI